jgi:hypothetical protein
MKMMQERRIYTDEDLANILLDMAISRSGIDENLINPSAIICELGKTIGGNQRHL